MFSWIYRYSKKELIVLLQEFGLSTEGTLDELRARAREYYTAHPEKITGMSTGPSTSTTKRDEMVPARQIGLPETSTVMSEMRKWGCTFDGRKPVSFLERLEELGVGYGFTGEQMLLGVSELFKGDSLLWFRNVRARIRTWGDFQAAFMDQFLPRHYQAQLKHELRNRLQKENEPYQKYELDMITLMRRAGGFSEDEQLLQLYDNMHPSYKLYVRIDDLNNVQNLRHRATEYENVGRRRPPCASRLQSSPPPHITTLLALQAARPHTSQLQTSG